MSNKDDNLIPTSVAISNWINDKVNYLVICLVSLLILSTLPFIGSSAGLGWTIPTTITGWIVFIVVRLVLSVANVMIYVSFIKQGIKEAKNTDVFKTANKKLIEMAINKPEKAKGPMSPSAWNKRTYGLKSASIVIGTIGASFAITQALLTFDWMAFISYILTIGGCILFGFQKKASTFDYWSGEYGDFIEIEYQKYLKEREKSLENTEVNNDKD